MIRVLDIFFVLIGLLLLAPGLFIVAVILRCSGEGEVIYKQKRLGKGQHDFHVYKFATMIKDSPSLGTGELTQFDDPRVLPVGKFLRKTKINELPQLFNVLIGDMTLVGPRPQTHRFFALFSCEARQEVSSVRPGVTGIASLIFRDEERLFRLCSDPVWLDDEVLTPFKGQLEIWFVKNKSVGLYFKILTLTFVSILFPNLTEPHKFFKGLPELPAEIQNLMKSETSDLNEGDL